MRTISVIIPALNEAAHLTATLKPLQHWRRAGHEVILVDGGSADDTPVIAAPLVDTLVSSEQGRARQMNCGASSAKGDILLFLHADTRLPDAADSMIVAALEHRGWGRFDVRLSGTQWPFRLIERLMNWRSCLSGIATGDQALFLERELYTSVGGFPDQPLMEDIAFSRRLKQRKGRPACVRPPLVTSSRRWEKGGIWRTVFLMWRLRLAYFLGVSPHRLVRYYRHTRDGKEV